MQIKNNLFELLQKHLEGTLRENEQQQLDEWAAESSANKALLDSVGDPAFLRTQLRQMHSAAKTQESRWNNIERVMHQQHTPPADGIHLLKTVWFRYAAIILLLFGTGVYLWSGRKQSTSMAKADPAILHTTALPGGNRAILTLADGSSIVLDSAASGNLASQGTTKIFKTADGQLAYEQHNAKTTGKHERDLLPQSYNTIATPRGGQYQITLPDGTRAWLNASSSLKFPTTFNGRVRQVEVTGEAYFEVAGDKTRPFYVKTASTEVEVLGTAFNVNAYEDEAANKTTLVEGIVKVTAGKTSILLQPGKQAVSGENMELHASNANIALETAWKNGMFKFNKASIETIMRQLARWYKLEVRYEGKVTEPLAGTFPRNAPISEVLEALQLTRAVRFKTEGSSVTVIAP